MSLCLDRFPKKMKRPLVYRDKGDNIGWGIYFTESLHIAMVVTVVFVLMLVAGLTFGICWSLLEQDIQGAWTVAAWITSTLALGLSALTAWATIT